MPRTTPFHSRLEALNETGIWKYWSGYLVAPQYQFSLNTEYYAIRSAVSLLDTSPLFKYRLTGADAPALLGRLLVRDIGDCGVGQVQYTCWCDQRGFVLQDGVVMQVASGEYRLTAGEPTLQYFRKVARESKYSDVQIDDVSTDLGILAVQGPLAHDVVSQLTDAVTLLQYFEVAQTDVAGCEVAL